MYFVKKNQLFYKTIDFCKKAVFYNFIFVKKQASYIKEQLFYKNTFL